MLAESYGLEHQRLLPSALEEKLRGWLAACIGVVLCLLAAAVWLSLITWSARDPSLTHTTFGPTRNLLGPPGAIISDLLLQTFGFAAVVPLFAVAMWGLELITARRIADLPLRLVLLPFSALALATGCSALPTAAAWPLQSGFGGVVGDLAYNAAAALLGVAIAGRSGGVAGLFCLSGGLAAFTYCLGLARRNMPRPVLPARSTWPSVKMPSLSRKKEKPTEPVREPQFDLGPRPTVVPAGAMRAPEPDLSAPRAPNRSAEPIAKAPVNPGPPVDDELITREPDFDLSTDIESRAIAARFAPANGPRSRDTDPALPISNEPEPPVAADLRGLDLPFSAPASAAHMAFRHSEPGYRRPSLNLLRQPQGGKPGPEFTQTVLRGTARLLVDVLADFGVKGEIKDIKPGPVVTLFELEPARGTKSSRVISLAEDIARSMSATSVRVAVVPGRNIIGIELPNARRESVLLREILDTEAYRSADAKLPLALGQSIGGDPIVVDLARMPHLLVAGTTGSGKSVGINAMVLSLLYRLSPDECRLLMIDPKMLELSAYNDLPHMLAPVVTDPHKAVAALNWAVREMEERYKRMALLGVRNIDVFNNRVRHAKARGDLLQRTVQTGFDRRTGAAVYETEKLALEPMPRIVVIVDEFADLMIVAGKEIEAAVQRLAQMARAAGIHLIMATQRPSVDVITGTIKANFPTRVSFKVTSKVDSRTILNEQGAEQLLGQGDMLFSPGSGQVVRVHGPFVSDEEVETITAYLREQGEPEYVEGITDVPVETDIGKAVAPSQSDEDELYDKAVALILRDRKASTSYLQRRLSIGYNRAADLIERMERDGIVSPASGSGKREILHASSQGAAAQVA